MCSLQEGWNTSRGAFTTLKKKKKNPTHVCIKILSSQRKARQQAPAENKNK